MTESAPDGSRTYDEVAFATCVRVLHRYSTSFGWTARLLGARRHRQIAALYAMARVADEIVDGTAAAYGPDPDRRRIALDDYERQVVDAIGVGYSTDLVLHAFARTATDTGIDASLVRPFFAAMRTDLGTVDFTTEAQLDDYVHGSAEVIGLMCVRVLTDVGRLRPADLATAENGARALGSALQRVNFLRDLGHDVAELHRRYLPGLQPGTPTAAGRDEVLTRIEDDLATARVAALLLPYRSRMAVACAIALFAALAQRLAAVDAADLERVRVRVPDRAKVGIVLTTVLGGSRRNGRRPGRFRRD